MATLDTPLREVIGGKMSDALAAAFKWGEKPRVEELLRHYPSRHIKRGEFSPIASLKPGDEVTIVAKVLEVRHRFGKGKKWLEVIVGDDEDEVTISFFGQMWITRVMTPGRTGLFAGTIDLFGGKKRLTHPEYQLLGDESEADEALEKFSGKYIPIYPASKKTPSFRIAKAIDLVLDQLDEIPDFLPQEVRTSKGFPSLHDAITEIHRKSDEEKYQSARERVKFDEAFLLQTLLLTRREQYRSEVIPVRDIRTDGIVAQFEKQLPFTFTDGQIQVCTEIENDMRSPIPMRRLLQGEVGSGKTVVALRAMLSVVESGGQAALLAPTEVLAQQHYFSITKMLGALAEGGTLMGDVSGTQVALLTGSVQGKARSEVLASIKNRSAGIVIGTHALLSEGVEFGDLALVVVDEQHRFGVEQRDALRAKAKHTPHLLVMTATPIPRTVAMTIFGDLDTSVLRQLPQGRKKIETHLIRAKLKPHYLERAWERIKEEVSQGHQAYIVCPRIGEEPEIELSDRDKALAKKLGVISSDEELSEEKATTAVMELAPELATGALKGLKVAPLTGKMPSEEKEAVMEAFTHHKLDVIVSTTVIEVGVDVPNATVMVIMDADRFGISQLHQLRGRVGRGGFTGLCLMVTNIDEDSPSLTRLEAVASTVDGFELARIDLEQRREGDILGKEQSGLRSTLRLLRVLEDESIIVEAREIAAEVLSRDSDLSEHPLLKLKIDELQADERSSYLEKD
jgi:ATP-dependent DNA helicase RecG